MIIENKDTEESFNAPVNDVNNELKEKEETNSAIDSFNKQINDFALKINDLDKMFDEANNKIAFLRELLK